MRAFMFTTLWANSAAHTLMIFFLFFSEKTGSDISCKLSPEETICMKCQNLKNKENIMSSAEYFMQSA